MQVKSGWCTLLQMLHCLIKLDSASAQTEAAILPPLLYNSYSNSREPGRFTCVTSNSDDVYWIINGIAHTHTSIRREREIVVYTYATDIERSQRSVIVIPVISANEHVSNIRCRAEKYSGGYQVIESMEIAQFNIQGLLDMPSNISYTEYNVTHNLVEWLEPETLNITDVEPDIENYSICLNITSECVNATEKHFFVPKYFVDIIVAVTAWNIVGESTSSAQLVIEACTATIPSAGTDQEYHVEVVFDPMSRNLTLLHIHFIDQTEESLSKSSHEFCPYLYKIVILEKMTHSIVTTQEIYGYYYSIFLELTIPKSQMYTVKVNRTSSTNILPLNPVDFNTNEIQNMNVTLMADSNLWVTLHLVAGTRLWSLTVLVSLQNHILLKQSVNKSEECFGLLLIQPCLISLLFNLSSILITGNKSLNISVLGSEAESIVNNELYFSEFVLQFSNEINTSNRKVVQINTTPTIKTIITREHSRTSVWIIDLTQGNSTQFKNSEWIISVAGCGSLFGMVLLFCSLLLFLKKKKCCRRSLETYHLQKQESITSPVAWSVSNHLSLKMSQNKAYEAPNDSEQVYEELPRLLQEDKSGTLTVPNRFYKED